MAAAGSPPLIRFCAVDRYFSAWARRSLEPAKFAAPAALAASMAEVAAFSFGAGSTVEQPTAAAPNAITATIRRMGKSSKRRVVRARSGVPHTGAGEALGDGFETTTVAFAPVGSDIARAVLAAGGRDGNLLRAARTELGRRRDQRLRHEEDDDRDDDEIDAPPQQVAVLDRVGDLARRVVRQG